MYLIFYGLIQNNRYGWKEIRSQPFATTVSLSSFHLVPSFIHLSSFSKRVFGLDDADSNSVMSTSVNRFPIDWFILSIQFKKLFSSFQWIEMIIFSIHRFASRASRVIIAKALFCTIGFDTIVINLLVAEAGFPCPIRSNLRLRPTTTTTTTRTMRVLSFVCTRWTRRGLRLR